MAEFLIIGALALDRPVWLSGALSPGARLRGRSLDGALAGRLGGGAANAGVALARAGHRVGIAAVVADDEEGRCAVAAAVAAGLDVAHVRTRRGSSARTLILIDPAGERAILHLDGAGEPPLLEPPGAGAVCVDGLFVRGAYPGAEAWAAACPGQVLAHWPAGRFEGPCDVLAASAADCAPEILEDPYAAGRAQVGARLKWMVLTHGAGDVVAYGPRGVVRVTPEAAAVVDATGAGDAFAAGLLEAMVGGADIEAALRHACRWGGVAVGHEGSAKAAAAFPAFRPASP